MEITVKSKNCQVPGRVKEEAMLRLEHATRFFDRVTDVEAVFAEGARRGPEPAHVELTARAKGHSIRVAASGADHRSALDVAVARFERQLAKYKTRLRDRRRRAVATAGNGHSEPAVLTLPDGDEEPAPMGARIVRSKRFELTPMLPEDAAWHLELLDHDFYVFRNASTGSCNVLYRRHDGDLGLIETTG